MLGGSTLGNGAYVVTGVRLGMGTVSDGGAYDRWFWLALKFMLMLMFMFIIIGFIELIELGLPTIPVPPPMNPTGGVDVDGDCSPD